MTDESKIENAAREQNDQNEEKQKTESVNKDSNYTEIINGEKVTTIVNKSATTTDQTT